MEFRSTNQGFCSPKDIQSNVGSSHGVHLQGGSTGGLVMPCGDDANISLTLVGKGTGGVTLGNSSQTVTIAGSGVTLTAGTAIKGAFSTIVAWTHAAISSGQLGEILVASTVADIMPGDLVFAESGVVAPVVQAGVRLSTAATSRVTIVLAVPGSTASSTLSGTARVTWLDLT